MFSLTEHEEHGIYFSVQKAPPPYVCLYVHVLYVYMDLTLSSSSPSLSQQESDPVPKGVLFVGDFGAKGDGLSNDTQAFKEAWEMACSYRARTRIVIPAGYNFLVHPVDFGGPCKSKVTLDISGTIVAPEDPAAWKGLNRRKWLYFHGVKHLTLEGGGTVNGMGWLWWAQSCKINKTNPCRNAPTAITFHKCKDLKVKNLKVLHLEIMCLFIWANDDSLGDDCISIVSNSSRIKIRNIVCGPGHGISIGSLGEIKLIIIGAGCNG
ncbi:hypothetical protein OIU78_010444 [Salix suchowensis]|nr:hypothetical protein OIU78_010444 [Salix suchowensis]